LWGKTAAAVWFAAEAGAMTANLTFLGGLRDFFFPSDFFFFPYLFARGVTDQSAQEQVGRIKQVAQSMGTLLKFTASLN
jgi:hypothetical protein